MLELMARGGMRIGEVLKLRMMDVEDCKLFLVSPESGRQNEVVCIPKKVAARLREYIRTKNMTLDERVFPIGYAGARQIVKQAARKPGIEISPPRSQAACCNVCKSFRSADRNCQQGDSPACQSFHHPAVSRQSQ